MANVKRESAPELAAFGDRSAPIVTRSEGLTAGTALEALGALEPGGHVFVLSKGAVSAGHVIAWALDQTGPADALISTWTVSPDEIKGLRRLVDRGRIRSLRMLMDFSFANRHAAYCAELRATFGPAVVALTVCHAKLAVLTNDAWALVVRSSANLNRNSRTEYHEVSDDRGLATFIVDALGAWFPPAADQWTVPVAEHKARFAAWGDRAPVAGRGDSSPQTSRSGLQPVAAADAKFFDDGPYGVDIRRAGLTYQR
jgi:hypothetical protein